VFRRPSWSMVSPQRKRLTMTAFETLHEAHRRTTPPSLIPIIYSNYAQGMHHQTNTCVGSRKSPAPPARNATARRICPSLPHCLPCIRQTTSCTPERDSPPRQSPQKSVKRPKVHQPPFRFIASTHRLEQIFGDVTLLVTTTTERYPRTNPIAFSWP